MRKRILNGIAGISLLAVLPACNVSRQGTADEEWALTLTEHVSAYIGFPVTSISLNPKYGNNRAELVKSMMLIEK